MPPDVTTARWALVSTAPSDQTRTMARNRWLLWVVGVLVAILLVLVVLYGGGGDGGLGNGSY